MSTLFSGSCSLEGEKAKKPNIILIMADDLGFETLGSYGGVSYKTPNLDRMAQTGIRFDHCYSQPLCTPSRVQIMTGIYNVRNYVKFGHLDRGQRTFANLLKKNGYLTCIAGKWQLGKEVDSPRHFGFDQSCLWQHTRGARNKKKLDSRYQNPQFEINGEEYDFSNGEYGPDIASNFICKFMEKNRKHPFIVYYPMILTHCPFTPTPDSKEWNPKSRGSRTYKGKGVFFADMVAYMDKIVGKIISKLEELGLRKNTLVLFTGDNGTDKPIVSRMKNGSEVVGGKKLMTDGGTHVPLIASWPGIIQSGLVSSDLIDFSDFLPTICQASGTAVPEKFGIDGRSFLPQLMGKKGHPRDWIYCWFSRNGIENKAKIFVRNKKFKLYGRGDFFDLTMDSKEKSSLDVEQLSKEARLSHNLLSKALARFKGKRK